MTLQTRLLGAVLAARLESRRSGGGHRAVSQVVVDSTSRAATLHMRSYTSKSRTLWSRAETEGHGQAAAMVKDLCIQIMMARGVA